MAACGFTTAMNLALVFDTKAFCQPSDAEPHCKGIAELQRHLHAKLEEANEYSSPPTASGTYAFRLGDHYNGLSETEKRRLLLSDIISWSTATEASASILCAPPKPEPLVVQLPKQIAAGRDAKSVAREAGKERKISDVKPFELGLNLDRQNRTVTETGPNGEVLKSRYNDFVTVNGAFGYTLPVNRAHGGTPTFWNDSLVTIYTSLEYAERIDPTKETDNLAFGFIASPQLESILPEYLLGNPRIDARWITDIEERDSAQWAVDVAFALLFLDPPDGWQPMLPIEWTVEGVLDYTHVIFPGDKKALAEVGEAFRAGYDVEWSLKDTLFRVGEFAPTLSGSYRFRDVIGRGAGNADIVTVDLGLLKADEKTGGLGLSVGYERGENLATLENIEAVRLKLLIRN